MSQLDKRRRNIVLGAGALVGAAGLVKIAGLDAVVASANRYQPNATSGADGKVLDASQLALLAILCQHIIPATDTPGAADVDVHGFVDHQLYHCHTKEEQAAARDILSSVERVTQERHGKRFANVSHDDQLGVLTDLEQAGDGFQSDERGAFKQLKSLIVFGYFTTQIGASRALRFMPYPGGYRGSIPHDAATPAWYR